MKIVVIGGAGVFGARLVDMLCRDGHDVWVAGRSVRRAEVVAQEHGAHSLALDRTGDLAPLWALAPGAVVDAAGPFHAYGDDPYSLARACITRGVHYLDLADDAAFCAGIAALDAQARDAGVFALSGVSSVPAVSSAIVAALIQNADEVDAIDIAILPGNRAPRGQSVVASILHQTGLPFATVLDGKTTPVRSWSQPAAFDLGAGIQRKGWMIGVPDQQLFPKAFQARSVTFRAGLELPVMNWGLAALSWMRAKIGFGVPDWFITLVRRAAQVLGPFGTDVGGMVVSVTLRTGHIWQQRTYRLLVREGDGPYIPGIAARTILRNPEAITHGAGPAVAVVKLAEIENAMGDLAAQHTRDEIELIPLFSRVLGGSIAALPTIVRAAHAVYGPRRLSGTAKVTRGSGVLARLIATVFGFPKPANAIPVTVTMTPKAGGEIWKRQFGQQIFRSHLSLMPNGMTEGFGPFTFLLDLHVRDNALYFPVRSGRFLGVPLPRFLLPKSIAREYAADGLFHFDVALVAPLGIGMIVHYQGTLS